MKTKTKILSAVTAAALAVLSVAHFINRPAAALPPPPFPTNVTFTWRIAPLEAGAVAISNMETWAEYKTNLMDTNWTRVFPTNHNYPASTNWVTNKVTVSFLPTQFFRSAYGFK